MKKTQTIFLVLGLIEKFVHSGMKYIYVHTHTYIHIHCMLLYVGLGVLFCFVLVVELTLGLEFARQALYH
jgi:hypothetical protein